MRPEVGGRMSEAGEGQVAEPRARVGARMGVAKGSRGRGRREDACVVGAAGRVGLPGLSCFWGGWRKHPKGASGEEGGRKWL